MLESIENITLEDDIFLLMESIEALEDDQGTAASISHAAEIVSMLAKRLIENGIEVISDEEGGDETPANAFSKEEIALIGAYLAGDASSCKTCGGLQRHKS